MPRSIASRVLHLCSSGQSAVTSAMRTASWSAILALFVLSSTAQAEVLKRCLGLTFYSDDQTVMITSDFPGGRMSRCVELGADEFAVTIQPEIEVVNNSAWYAFQVKSTIQRVISLRLMYEGGTHRYLPKISRDGHSWQTADHLLANQHPMGREVVLKVPVDGEPLWIAGQEMLSTEEVAQWTDELSQKSHVKKTVIGESIEGRPLHRLEIAESQSRDTIFIVARQHPPEVSGAIGMMHFVNTIAGDDKLSRSFRSRYSAIVVPTMNPDGVAHGHWRTNAAGVDLNRDWGHFTQPETRAVRDEVLSCVRSDDKKLCLFLDFHSTFGDVFFTQPRNQPLFPSGFTNRWLSSIQNRFPDYQVVVDDAHNAHRSTSKAWIANNFGVTAITYEFGDETDRETIRSIATGSAQEMMRLLLDLPATSSEQQLASKTEVAQVR
jgi:cytosolic carboxypeptidase protein 6